MSDGQGVDPVEKENLSNGEVAEQELEGEGQEQEEDSQGSGKQDANVDPVGVQKRLKRKDREHQRQMRALEQRINDLQGSVQKQQPASDYQDGNSAGASPDDQIERAVRRALQQREEMEKQAKAQEHQQYLQQQYQGLQSQLDSAADKYDDFDDVVMAQDAPYTDAMRDTALLLPNAADVLYKLGKDKEKLKRISKLHPLEQGKEVVKLAFALMNGGGAKSSVPDSMSQIKTSPAANQGNKMSASSIRQMMRQGKWK